jgi:hypothetical protein
VGTGISRDWCATKVKDFATEAGFCMEYDFYNNPGAEYRPIC